MLLFMDEAKSRRLLISNVPLFPPVVYGPIVLKLSKNPLLDKVELRLKKRLIAAYPSLQANFKPSSSVWKI
jgi:hypothetical protein